MTEWGACTYSQWMGFKILNNLFLIKTSWSQWKVSAFLCICTVVINTITTNTGWFRYRDGNNTRCLAKRAMIFGRDEQALGKLKFGVKFHLC